MKWFKKHFYLLTWLVNIFLALVFLTCLVTGVLMFPGFLELMGIRARNFPTETVAFIHDWSGLAMGTVVLFHVWLHWRQLKQFVKIKILRPRRPAED